MSTPTRAPDAERLDQGCSPSPRSWSASLLAGVVSYYASGSPDGLNKVAADQGLADKEKESAAADSPLAGYSTKDVDNERLSGGLAGVVGVGVVLVIAGGARLSVRAPAQPDRRAD